LERREVAYRFQKVWYHAAMDVDEASAVIIGAPYIKEVGSYDAGNKGESPDHGTCKKCGKNKHGEPKLPPPEKKDELDQPQFSVFGEPHASGFGEPQARGFGDFVKGAVGLAKSELGIGHADDETIAERRRICKSCEHQDLGVCGECGCYCAAKVRLSKETCPIGEW